MMSSTCQEQCEENIHTDCFQIFLEVFAVLNQPFAKNAGHFNYSLIIQCRIRLVNKVRVNPVMKCANNMR